MNLHQRGAELINALKGHILEVLHGHPDAEPGGTGVFQEEIARRAGLHNMGTGNWTTPVVKCCGYSIRKARLNSLMRTSRMKRESAGV